MKQSSHHAHIRRAAILLELLIALAILVSASAVMVGAVRTTLTGLARERDRQTAIDLACSKMAEIEAGITSIETMHDRTFDLTPSLLGASGRGGVGANESASTFDETDLGPKRWRIEVDRERSRFPGLSLVTIRVFDTRGSMDESGVESCTLRQLVRLPSQAGDEEDFLEADLSRADASAGGGR